MAKVLTGADIDEIVAECRANGEISEYSAGPESFWQMPSPLGWGYGRHLQLRPGLWLTVGE